ncbi:MAG: hypothetical protein R3D51_17620 [Hyphomicrobiaceae bacterium]
MDTTSNTFARRARLSTAAIALAVALTAAAVAAVMYSSGKTELAGYQLDSPIHATTEER